MSFRELITDEIKKNREKLSASSLKTYVSTLFNLHKNMKSDDISLKFFDNSADILQFLDEKPSTTQKTILSALFVLTGNDKYRELMLTDCKSVNDNYKLQKKDIKQDANWMTIDEIKSIYTELETKVKSMFSGAITADNETIVQFFLLAFLGGVSGLPPRRSLDYALLKIRNFDVKTDNYYKSNKLYFNKYKTSEVYGLQSLDVPEELNVIIKKWVKVNTANYFLFSSNGNPLTSP